jgi:hypothetical protein
VHQPKPNKRPCTTNALNVKLDLHRQPATGALSVELKQRFYQMLCGIWAKLT